jgi:FlaA1/EpsC-like NDP-sugar epimerase
VTSGADQATNWLSRWRWALFDGGIWFAAIYVATWLRFNFEVTPVFVSTTLLVALAAMAGHVLVGGVIGPYAVGHQRGSFEETTALIRSVLVIAVFLLVWALVADPPAFPRSVPVIGGALALVGMFAVRFVIRSSRSHQSWSRAHERRVVVFGAGSAGRRLVRSMGENGSGFFPAALLDDDKAKTHLRIDGVRVRGTRNDIASVAREFDATALVLALPLAGAELIRELTDLATDAGLDVLILPPLRDIIGDDPTSFDLRDVNLEDLLGREQITLDTTLIADRIEGRSVLVTGAGGSIGSELCCQIARFAPAKLYLLDRDESALQATQIRLTGQGLLQSDKIILADIRDIAALRTVFRLKRPDIVFHAAALKHLPLLESFPLEAWKTNVLGTANVLTAAAESGVGTFVNISTDKAADPTCMLGYSKRLAEQVTADFARTQPGHYVSVRFGNVLGSRGSVLRSLAVQIQRGGPVTITDPDVARFFMLIPEACQLVLEAAAIGTNGEVMVLEMGKQVKILQMAKTLIRLSGRKDINISYTGLRPGEKLREDLFSGSEDRKPTTNRLVNSVSVPSLGVEEVRSVEMANHKEAASWMRQACQHNMAGMEV